MLVPRTASPLIGIPSKIDAVRFQKDKFGVYRKIPKSLLEA